MPELPEVETVRRDLAAAVLSRRIATAEVTGRRSVRRQSAPAFSEALVGRALVRARRHGKYLLLDLDDGAVLVAHLRMSGQLSYGEGGRARAAHTHVVITFEDRSELRFVDPRTFGELFVAEELDARRLPVCIGTQGIDPIAEGLSEVQLAALLGRRRTATKAFLLDQSAIAGIGNIYSDEILFRSRLRPAHRTDALRRIDVRRLCTSVTEVLEEAVTLRGSSLRDERYRDLNGVGGAFQERHAVYGRVGLPCPTCATPVSRVRVAGRSAHFCPRCQR